MNKPIFKFLLLFTLSFMTVKTFAQNTTNIHFEVSFTEPQAHYADVKMEITNLKKDEITVKMPVWAPGSYLVREFSKNIESFNVSTKDNSSVSFEKVRKNAWKINTKGKNSITVSYRVYAFEVSVRTSFVDASHAFLSPTGIFMFVDGGLADASTVKIVPYKTWSKVSTGLDPLEGGKLLLIMQKTLIGFLIRL
jgi:predicted metalloprotease with PDZ domain